MPCVTVIGMCLLFILEKISDNINDEGEADELPDDWCPSQRPTSWANQPTAEMGNVNFFIKSKSF